MSSRGSPWRPTYSAGHHKPYPRYFTLGWERDGSATAPLVGEITQYQMHDHSQPPFVTVTPEIRRGHVSGPRGQEERDCMQRSRAGSGGVEGI